MKFSNFSFSMMGAFTLLLFFSPITQASVRFANNWQQWNDIALNERRVTELLESAGGRVGFAAKQGDLLVIAGPHRTPGGDPYMHITVAIREPRPQETCHVHLVNRHNILVVHDVTCE